MSDAELDALPEAELRGHRPADADEASDLEQMRRFVARHAEPFDRRIAEGHLTASALVLEPTGRRVLLLHHRKLKRWLQPGGHGEPGEREGARVALREAREETGIDSLALHPSAPRPLDVDVHDIPPHGEDGGHQHLDLRYLVVAPADAHPVCAEHEARDVRWFEWRELPALALDPGLERAIAKARQLLPPPE